MTKMKIIATLSLAYELLEEVYYLDELNNEDLNNCLEVISKKYTDIYETIPTKELIIPKKNVILKNALSEEEIPNVSQIRIDSMISWGYYIYLKNGDTRCMTINEAKYDWRKLRKTL